LHPAFSLKSANLKGADMQERQQGARLGVALGAAAFPTLTGSSALARENGELSRGHTVYIPAYSHIWYGNVNSGAPSKLLLSSMLSIRNIDPGHSITLKAVRYYDSDGKLLREENKALRNLGSLASTDVFVEYKDTSGGTGANFIVVWEADAPVNPPIIETVNTYFLGAAPSTFSSRGRPIRTGEGQ
jgi:hypothetical protein